MAKAWLKKLLLLALGISLAYILLRLVFFVPVAKSAHPLELIPELPKQAQFKLDIHIQCWTSLSRAAEIERLLNEVLKEDYPTITIELEMEVE